MWIAIEVIAVGAYLACQEAFPYPFGVFLGVIVFFAITLPNIARRTSRSRLTTRFYENTAYYNAKCSMCTLGTQFYRVLRDGTTIGWGKIPVKNRIAQRGSVIFHPNQANIRRCPHCQGMGFTPKLRKGAHSTERTELVWPPRDGVPYAAEPFHEEEPPEPDLHGAEYRPNRTWRGK